MSITKIIQTQLQPDLLISQFLLVVVSLLRLLFEDAQPLDQLARAKGETSPSRKLS